MFLFNTLAGVSTLIGLGLVVFSMFFLFISPKHRINHKPYVIIAIAMAAITVQVIAVPFRVYVDFTVSTFFSFVSYLLLAHLFLKRYAESLKPREVLFALTIGALVLQLPFRISDFNGSLISLPDLLVGMLGIFAGYFLNKRQRLLYRVNLALSIVVLAFTLLYGYDLWINTLNFGSPTGDLNEKGPSEITLITQKNGPVHVQKGKITVMDFWFVGCGACITEFPNFQRSYNQHKTDSRIQFYSVNKPTVYDKGVEPFGFLTEKGFNFPMTVMNDVSIMKDMQITVFPTVVILNESGNIVYRGDMDGADKKLRTLL